MTTAHHLDTILDVLQRTREALSDPRKWSQRKNGRFSEGRCAALAIDKVAGNGTADITVREYFAKANGLTDAAKGIHEWNDALESHAELLAGFNRAISARAGELEAERAEALEVVDRVRRGGVA